MALFADDEKPSSRHTNRNDTSFSIFNSGKISNKTKNQLQWWILFTLAFILVQKPYPTMHVIFVFVEHVEFHSIVAKFIGPYDCERDVFNIWNKL